MITNRVEGAKTSSRSILIVDDDPVIRRLFKVILLREYDVREADSGEEALKSVALSPPSLVLLDIMMPGIGGYKTCRRLKATSARAPQVIMVSANSAPEEQLEAFQQGADDYLVKPVEPCELRARIQLHFRLLESREITANLKSEIDDYHVTLRQSATERTRQITALQDVAVLTLARVAESRDNETGAHLLRLREYAQLLAEQLAQDSPYANRLDEPFLADLYRSTPLHDIGKVGITDDILLKPGRFTPDEFEIMKRHTVIGANILDDAVMQVHEGGFLAMAGMIARFHHERWDGTGYPAGLVGEEIPLAARIVSVADVYDALTSKRPYKEAWSPDDATRAIIEGSGTQFDPIVVAAFQRCREDFLRVQRQYGDRVPTVIGAMAFVDEPAKETGRPAAPGQRVLDS